MRKGMKEMSDKKEMLRKYGQAVEYLPPRLRDAAQSLTDEEKLLAEEFRLRAGKPFSVTIGGKEIVKNAGTEVRREELQTVLEIATRSSVHTSHSAMKEGYITVFGGHRIGLCGSIVRKGDEISAIREISSVSIRIAKEIKTAAEKLFCEIQNFESMGNTLIISPPGFGKTTMLRDLIRRFSDSGTRISLVDERGEVAAKKSGVPQFDVGRCTDVLDNVKKAEGAMLLLRAMSPEIIAFDEITARDDIGAISSIINCGVGIIATAHGESEASLSKRPLYRELFEMKVFNNIVILKKENGNFSYTLKREG